MQRMNREGFSLGRTRCASSHYLNAELYFQAQTVNFLLCLNRYRVLASNPSAQHR